MSAGDSLGSCRHRGERGHLPHPDGTSCLWREQDGALPVPGVYSADQAAPSPAPNPTPGSDGTEAWLEGYRFALLNPDDPGVQADLAKYQAEQAEQRERLVDELQAEVAALRSAYEERGEALAQVTRDRRALHRDYQQALRMLEEVTGGRDQAREAHAECMREVAQLHRQLDSLGTSPDRLAELVGAGMAVTLFGRTYVDRDHASATYDTQALRDLVGHGLDLLRQGSTDPDLWTAEQRSAVTALHNFRDGLNRTSGYDSRWPSAAHLDAKNTSCACGQGVRVGADGSYRTELDGISHGITPCYAVDAYGQPAATELLEAQGGVFVPIPKGHMLSVTVTPYEDVPTD